jgi:hypothetical protein
VRRCTRSDVRRPSQGNQFIIIAVVLPEVTVILAGRIAIVGGKETMLVNGTEHVLHGQGLLFPATSINHQVIKS